VRSHAFRHLLQPGTQLIASGFPRPASPLRLGLTPSAPLQAAASPALADRLQLWLGDDQPGQVGYRQLFLFNSALPDALNTWVDSEDPETQPLTNSLLLAPGQAFYFLRQPAGNTLIVEPSPTQE
jgi:hypothetical protein